jgi:choline dehydrogenase-like flavoprotein
MDADVIVVGHGLAGLAAAAEVADAGRRVVLVDQEPEQSLGGRPSGASAVVPRRHPRAAPDGSPRQPRARALGLDGQCAVRPRGGSLAAPRATATRCRASTSRGGPVRGRRPSEKRVRAHAQNGLIRFAFRHRVDDLVVSDGSVTGVRGKVLAPDSMERGRASNREERPADRRTPQHPDPEDPRRPGHRPVRPLPHVERRAAVRCVATGRRRASAGAE